MAEEEGAPPPRGGGGLGKKIGPFPMGVWALILGGGAGLIWFWRKKSSGAADTTTSTDAAAGGSGDTSPTSLVPINQGLSEDQAQSILDAIKKLQGGDSDDDDDDKPPKPPAKPPAKPPKKPPKVITTVKWTKHNTPWNSTLWGIAHHEHVAGGWQYLERINHITGDPKKHLKPGMKIKLSA